MIREFLSKEVFTAQEVYRKVQAYELISTAKSSSTSGFGSALLAAPMKTGQEEQALMAASYAGDKKKDGQQCYSYNDVYNISICKVYITCI
jgi:hypothetical protein